MSEVSFSSDSGSPAEVAAQVEETAKVDAARAELYDEAAGDTGLILGKYQTTEDLANAYQSLQREYSRLKSGQAPVQQEQPAEEADEGEEAEAEEAPASVDPGTVERIQRQIFDQVGGEAEYQRLATWAAKSLPAERTNAYNKALEAADEGMILNALKGLQYDYMMQNGYEPRLSGGRAPSTEAKGYSSRYQIQQAMSDPRYEHDAGYRKDVERRIAVTSDAVFGQ